MPIQLGKNFKMLAELGIDICEFCHEPAAFSVYEQFDQVLLMFVPVAKYHRKKYLVCERCRHPTELDEARALGLIAEAKGLPSHEAAAAIWNALDQALNRWMTDEEYRKEYGSIAELLQGVSGKLESQFPASHVKRIAKRYFAWCTKDLD
jgi:hypothetical protein